VVFFAVDRADRTFAGLSPVKIDSIRLTPAFDTYAGIGAGFEFSVRFPVQASTDPEFKSGLQTMLDATANDLDNPGHRDTVINTSGVELRFIRVTATLSLSVKGDVTTWNEMDARAELAKSMTSRDNPLLWRSIVNRLWQWSLGKPLVGTPSDFRRMGMGTSHPELLDCLAARLRDHPQHSWKSIVRLIATSDAYRRSSDYLAKNALADRDNTYLWRGQRRRLTAEEFRDTVLPVSAGATTGTDRARGDGSASARVWCSQFGSRDF
jgi:hypothetical protein